MPNLPPRLIIITILVLASFPVVAEELQCKFTQKFKGGGSKGADVQLSVVNGKIEKLVVYSYISSGKEGGGYVCGIDTSEQDQKIKWTTTDKKAILEVEYDLPTPIEKNILEIEKVGNTYKINLERASRSGCGFGAEWPQEIALEKGKNECRVVYQKY